MVSLPVGDYVKHSDYAALQARVAELGRELNQAKYGQPDFAWSVHKQALADAVERAEAAEALLPEAVKAGMLYGAKVKPLVWGYHPCGAIAAPPTGHAYIIDTRMKGRCYSVKGFNPERQFASLDEAKVAAQADYEQRIRTAMDEPDPETIARIVAQLKEGRG